LISTGRALLVILTVPDHGGLLGENMEYDQDESLIRADSTFHNARCLPIVIPMKLQESYIDLSKPSQTELSSSRCNDPQLSILRRVFLV
jgi:hypothetical protein